MNQRKRLWIWALLLAASALSVPVRSWATGVPVGGFLPLVGIGLTDEFNDDLDPFAQPSDSPGGPFLGNSNPHYDIALVDTGAAVSLLTAQADSDFNMNGPYPGESDGFRGTEEIQIGGATGILFATINDPLGLYAGGLQGRAAGSSFAMNHSALEGQTNTSLITIPAESDLPNVLGLSFASRYATYIRNDAPQIFTHNGKTVRSPHIEFLPRGSGGQGIARRAPLSLNPGASFQSAPFWFINIAEFDLDNPHENPSQPTVIQGGLFLNVSVQNEGQQLNNSQFFFDTGADVTVVSQFNAVLLGFDPVLDEPEFTVAVIGSAGIVEDVPGFFADSFTIPAIGGSITLTNVPIVVLDVPDPSNPSNIVPGIVGTNLLAGRNVVIDPNPALGGGGVGPSLYVSDPVTNQKNWTSTAASGSWETAGNWSGPAVPDTLSVTNVRHVSGGDQTAVLAASTQVWELNVSGGSGGQTMTVAVENATTLTTFSGINIEPGGAIELRGGALDTQFVEIFDGTLRGSGTLKTGSGSIPGQVENRSGTVSPGVGIGALSIEGRFANGVDGTLAFELGGTTPGTQYDQLLVDGSAALDGTLSVTLADLGGGMFTPTAGNSFTLLTASEGVGGMFDELILPGGFQWNVDYNPDSVVLSLIGLGLAGDYNSNSVVDVADYLVWRNSNGEMGSGLAADGNGDQVVNQDDYALWRSNFGRTAMGAGAASIGATGVPEPASQLVALLAACGLATQRVPGRTRRRTLTPRVPCGASKKCSASCSW
jgi:hypothetical protein